MFKTAFIAALAFAAVQANEIELDIDIFVELK